MNSIWNKNISLFKARFPQLFYLLENEMRAAEKNPYNAWQSSLAKNGSVTALENGIRLHSAYNPEKEALSVVSEKIFSHPECSALVFCGFGLGYGAIEAVKLLKKDGAVAAVSISEKSGKIYDCLPSNQFLSTRFAQVSISEKSGKSHKASLSSVEKTLVLIEPNAQCFFFSLSFVDWEEVFHYDRIVFLISCPVDQCIPILNNLGILKSVFFMNKAHTQHAQGYFDTLSVLIERNREKERINEATTKKFGRRWNLNCLKNAEIVSCLDGIAPFKDSAKDIPFTVIAAGPSLSAVLPFLKEIQRRTVTVCVDTALRACLAAGVEPDFIIISDPQYWAYRHIADVKALSSMLIASGDVYPSVFRFHCKKIVCASSQLPIGKYFEAKCGVKGDLGAGGSVASSAWNFSAWCGAKKVFLVGLDLAFSKKQTHFKGSVFEEAAHFASQKTRPAENFSVSSMISGNMDEGEDYAGEKVATDQRMKMFAWWFESRLLECPDVQTYTLFDGGLKIPGVAVSSVDAVISLPIVESQKTAFFETASKRFMDTKAIENCKKKYRAASDSLKQLLANRDVSDFFSVENAVAKYLECMNGANACKKNDNFK